MNKNFYENIYKIRYSEFDCNLLLKPSSLLQLLQDVASNNAEALDFGYSFLVKKNLAWFLLKYHIEFSCYPQNTYNINIKTEPRGYNKLFAYRDFIINNGQDDLGKATTTWGLVDLETKNMVNLAEIFSENPKFTQFVKREDDLKYNKIKNIEKIDCEKIFEIRFDDLDVNQHVNNSNYLIWAFETLNYDFRNTKRLKVLDMVFKKEAKFGSNIVSQLEINNNITNHKLKDLNTNEELCLIQAEWD